MRVFRNVYSSVRDVLDLVVNDASDAPAIHMDSVSSRTLDGVSVNDGRSTRGGTGQMNAVPPTSERETLDRNVLAPDEDRVSCVARGLDHRLPLTVESDPNDLGRNSDVFAAHSANQHGVPRLRQRDLLLDLFSSVTIDR
jgi:hypothetical protein